VFTAFAVTVGRWFTKTSIVSVLEQPLIVVPVTLNVNVPVEVGVKSCPSITPLSQV